MRAINLVGSRVGYALSEPFLVLYFMRQLFPTKLRPPHLGTVSPNAKATWKKRRCVSDGATKNERRVPLVNVVIPHNSTSTLLSHPEISIVMTLAPENTKCYHQSLSSRVLIRGISRIKISSLYQIFIVWLAVRSPIKLNDARTDCGQASVPALSHVPYSDAI